MNDANTVHEWDLAERMGAANEFQRYPGHPAQTCLSSVLGEPLARKLNKTTASLLKAPDRPPFIEEFMKIAPRVAARKWPTTEDYSSQGGTIRAGGGQLASDATAHPVTPDTDRLYASVDELSFMSPVINDATVANPTGRTATTLATVSGKDATPQLIEMAKFFLTANSKAPEQNLFNLPRVAIWPVSTVLTQRSAFDKLITFCSTVGDKTSGPPFLFQRTDPDSATADWTGIANNQKVYAYLQALTGRTIPGWKSSSTFLTKWPSGERDQILTEIFDYIRCTNLVDTSNPDKKGYTPKRPPADPNSMLTSRGQVVPIVINGSRGFGRIATISELAVVLVRQPDKPTNATDPSIGTMDAAPTTAKIECALLPKLFCPMAGYSSLGNWPAPGC
jgi:hypothetical protein